MAPDCRLPTGACSYRVERRERLHTQTVAYLRASRVRPVRWTGNNRLEAYSDCGEPPYRCVEVG
jgi:hypothetical protein